jgi:hypothetical protein
VRACWRLVEPPESALYWPTPSAGGRALPDPWGQRIRPHCRRVAVRVAHHGVFSQVRACWQPVALRIRHCAGRHRVPTAGGAPPTTSGSSWTPCSPESSRASPPAVAHPSRQVFAIAGACSGALSSSLTHSARSSALAKPVSSPAWSPGDFYFTPRALQGTWSSEPRCQAAHGEVNSVRASPAHSTLLCVSSRRI